MYFEKSMIMAGGNAHALGIENKAAKGRLLCYVAFYHLGYICG